MYEHEHIDTVSLDCAPPQMPLEAEEAPEDFED